jgi:cytochrome P450
MTKVPAYIDSPKKALILRILYNLFVSPLRSIPGPWLWRATRLPYALSLIRGTLVHDIQKIHTQYGPIVCLAPDEVSFTLPEALPDIYLTKQGRVDFPKNPIWWDPIPGQAQSIVSLPTGREHARIRRALAPAFKEKVLVGTETGQEGILKKYAGLFVAKLREQLRKERSGGNREQEKSMVIDIAKWFNFATFDIMGDLLFAEPFYCLSDSKYHVWIETIFENLKAIAYLISMRLVYRPIETLLFSNLPKKATQAMDDHYALTCSKVKRRLELKAPRADVVSYIFENVNDGKEETGKANDKGLTHEEIEGSFNSLMIAGSETSATCLTATTLHLVNNPEKLRILQTEIRSAFKASDDINLTVLKELPYLNAVLNESLRISPPVPVGLNHVVPKGGATVCGLALPGGVSILPRLIFHRELTAQ